MRVILTPAERLVLQTSPGVASMLAVVRAARREMADPGRPKVVRLGFPDTLRYTMLVGFHRQPLFFIAGPVVALICYAAILVKLFI